MIRPMRRSDVADAMALKEAAGWNQTSADWELLLSVEPEGCWVYEADGRAVGATTAVAYQKELAWIGMVLVLPEYRRRGIARALLAHALDWCDRRGVECIKLDATEMGRPLYLQAGFVDEEPIERWGGTARTSGGELAERLGAAEEAAAQDRAAFGAERGRILQRLIAARPAEAWTASNGYALTRPGSRARFFGPCVADDPAAAGRLARAALASCSGEAVFWDLLPANQAAVELARESGFEPLRRLMRMARPAARKYGRPERVFAACGFEYG